MANQASQIPIVINCFNRIEYAEQLATSLAGVKGIHARTVLIFQDGEFNHRSNTAKATDQELQAVSEVFGRELPQAQIFRSAQNRGIAESISWAQQGVFDLLEFEWAYFLEDDVVLAPDWLAVMDTLVAQAEAQGYQGFISAYGPYGLSVDQQLPRKNQTELVVRHLRAYAQSQQHSKNLRNFLEPFYLVMQSLDYSDVRARAIAIDRELSAWFKTLGSKPVASSQDGFRDWGSRLLGFSDLHTVGSWVRYTGERGVHDSSASFSRIGYAKTELLTLAVEAFDFPEPGECLAWNEAQLAQYEVSVRESQDTDCQGTPVLASGSMNVATEESEPVERFPSTLRPDEYNFLRDALAACSVFLEYGTGGSTFLAADQNVSTIISIETDSDYLESIARDMERYDSVFIPVHCDLGPTKTWGYPADDSSINHWPSYFMGGWAAVDDSISPPDLVLVDGRFRVASFIVSYLLAPDNATILFSDYVDRPHYHAVERFCAPERLINRMAVFVRRKEDLESRWLSVALEQLAAHVLDPR